MQKATLVLADGAGFERRVVSAPGFRAGEVCFTTAMAGHAWPFTDPSYAPRALVCGYS